jgi:hypothetical protein
VTAASSGIWLLFALSACASPGTRGAPGPTAPPPAASAPASVPASRRAPLAIEKRYTGGTAAPRLVVKNGFPSAQYVFVDFELAGRVGPGANAVFELSPGSHTVTSADSADPDDNPVSITEAFEIGFSYSYAVTPE